MDAIVEYCVGKYPKELNAGNIVLQDDGCGVYIKTWAVAGVQKPTIDQINSEIEAVEIKVELELIKAEIYQKLDEIDMKSIRALRTGDTERLEKLEAEAVELRSQLVK